MTVLDTSALIDFLVDGPLAKRVEHLLAEGSAAVSAISVYELLAGVTSKKHQRERRDLLTLVRVIEVDGETAIRAAGLFTALRQTGLTVDNEDLLVAATALRAEAALLTANTGHFDRISGLLLA